MDLRPVLFVIGILLSTLSLSMAVPMLVDMYFHSPDWIVFFLCILTTSFFGGALVLSNSQGEHFTMNIRQAFLLTTLSWVVLALFAALPLWLSEFNLSFTDAYFEAMSGITTTGSTVISGLDDAPRGFLIWRAILQWLGGIGIIVMALSVLPFLKVGGMQLFRMESSEKNEKAMPRAAKLAANIGYIYVGLTLVCAICYHYSGLGIFDSVAHAMTTIATGGFSTFDSSFGSFEGPRTEITAIIFMFLGGLPFVLYVKALHGNPGAIFRDSQVRWFFMIVLGTTILLTLYLLFHAHMPFGKALLRSAFNVVSIITGTGYTNHNYNGWGGFAVGVLFFLMVIGGCAGSTTCGIKVFRFQVLYAVTTIQFKKLLHPHGVFIPHYAGKPLPEGVPASVMSFFFMYAAIFAVLAIALSLTGLDYMTSMSGAATAISNVGPALGEIIGPNGTFAPLPNSAKWVLCIGMLMGRLELFTVLVLFTPGFWKR